MTPVYVQGHGSDIIREAVRALRHVPPTGSVLILLGWLSLAFGGQRWFVLVSTLGYPSVALGSAFFLLMAGAIMLLHAGQLLLAPGVTVPEPPAVASRLRRLWRVTLAELAVMGGIGIALGLADAAGSSQLARFAAQHLVWRDAFAGLPSPASAWLVAWCTYCLAHTPGLSWLWPATAANYPSGTWRATLILASGAGRRTPWLAHATIGTSLCLAVLTAWHARLAWLALLPLLLWPAVANAAAARIQPAEDGGGV